MTSYLVDGILLLALVLTSIRVGAMYRELKRLRALQDGYRSAVGQGAEALARMENAVREINGGGAQILAALGARIDEARALMAEMDEFAGGEGTRGVRMIGKTADETRSSSTATVVATPAFELRSAPMQAARREARPPTVALALRTASASAL